MDAVLQIFKRSICPGTPFFESLAKKPPTTMDDLFRRANKYSMLEDDVRAATQQEGPSRPEMPPLTPLSISYEKLLPMIQGLSDFKWPRPIGTDPSMRDRKQEMRLPHTSAQMLEGRNASQHHKLWGPEGLSRPQGCHKLYQWGPSDEEYDSRRKRQKLLRAASIRERINSIRRVLPERALAP
ncbi:hypothetical protein CK203_045368 [Vitis vinifera]|uniref:Uncharacterized protein n=1 Tax=Vitis vinifera TaxID=29760 RepID=A0A438H9B7_VITVI|nr:hypothetical protein CK203_045368 [Vitis vinifera]